MKLFKKKSKDGYREGATSFYVVAFSTLILIVIAVSFATIIISEVTRTLNDDLSQSAYDAAMAGIEDAKLAFFNYQKCLEAGVTVPEGYTPNSGGAVTCEDIIYWMENPDCDMVGHILGRVEKTAKGEVPVETTFSSNNMQQAYTCVKINTHPITTVGSLSPSTPTRVVRVSLDEGVNVDDITEIVVGWSSDGTKNYGNFSGGKVHFTGSSNPPTLSVQLIQTSSSFSLAQFDKVSVNGSNWSTNRGTVFLVPTNSSSSASSSQENGGVRDNFVGVYNGSKNVITAEQLAKSNDRTVKNLPYAVYCDPSGTAEFDCSANIQLPKPIGGARIEDTFLFVVSTPYVGEQQGTDYSIAFLCADGGSCGTYTATAEGADGEEVQQVSTSGIEIIVDSTGRANDLYRRIETRLGVGNDYPYPFFAIELLGNDISNGGLLRKDLSVTSENSFGTYASFLDNYDAYK